MELKITKTSKSFWMVTIIVVWLLGWIALTSWIGGRIEFWKIFNVSTKSPEKKNVTVSDSFSGTSVRNSEVTIDSGGKSAQSVTEVNWSFNDSDVQGSKILIK